MSGETSEVTVLFMVGDFFSLSLSFIHTLSATREQKQGMACKQGREGLHLPSHAPPTKKNPLLAIDV